MELQTERTEPLKEILGELFSLLEAQETQSAAVLQFLKDQGIATEEKLAPYLEQAGNGSNVKWLAARKRMEYLLTPVPKEVAVQKEITDNTKEAEHGKSKEAAQGSAKQSESNVGSPSGTVPEGAELQRAGQHSDGKHDRNGKNESKTSDADKAETAKAKAASGNTQKENPKS